MGHGRAEDCVGRASMPPGPLVAPYLAGLLDSWEAGQQRARRYPRSSDLLSIACPAPTQPLGVTCPGGDFLPAPHAPPLASCLWHREGLLPFLPPATPGTFPRTPFPYSVPERIKAGPHLDPAVTSRPATLPPLSSELSPPLQGPAYWNVGPGRILGDHLVQGLHYKWGN